MESKEKELIERSLRMIGFLNCCIKCGEALNEKDEKELVAIIRDLTEKLKQEK